MECVFRAHQGCVQRARSETLKQIREPHEIFLFSDSLQETHTHTRIYIYIDRYLYISI